MRLLGSQVLVPYTSLFRSQVTVEVGLPQAPFWHVSPLVQALLSLQAVPLALFGFEHTPLIGSQVPATWHWLRGAQVWVAVTLPQALLWPVSPLVQALLSLSAVPLALFGFEHPPLIGSEVPATGLCSFPYPTLFRSGLPQAPFWHVSPLVQALLSLQAVPLALFGFEHTPLIGSQVPATWH